MKTLGTISFALATSLTFALTGCGSSVSDGTGGGGEGGGGPDTCEDYAAGMPAAPREVAVRFFNYTDADLYVGDPQESCGGYLPYTLARGDYPVKPQAGPCEPTCAQAMSSECFGCPAVCEVVPTIRIAPGGVYERSWSGVEYLAVELPEECVEEGACGGSCNLPQAGGGVYDATGFAYAELTGCSDPASCDCELIGPANFCELPGNAKPTGEARVVSVSFDYGSGEGDLEFFFE